MSIFFALTHPSGGVWHVKQFHRNNFLIKSKLTSDKSIQEQSPHSASRMCGGVNIAGHLGAELPLSGIHWHLRPGRGERRRKGKLWPDLYIPVNTSVNTQDYSILLLYYVLYNTLCVMYSLCPFAVFFGIKWICYYSIFKSIQTCVWFVYP